MNLLRLLFLGPLSILCLKSTAQVDDLMRDKNITWIAESYNDFLTDASAEEKIGKRLSVAKMLKFYNPTESDMPEAFVLQNYILELAKAEKLTIYKDDRCTQEVSYSSVISWIDSFRFIEPTTYYVNRCRLGANFIAEEDILFFRAHQILYYDSSKVQFSLRTLAVAPMKQIRNDTGAFMYWIPIFWLKVSDLKEKRVLSDESITWAKGMTLVNGVALKADSVKILKQMSDSIPIAPLFQAVLTKPNIPFYRPDSLPLWVKYTFAETQKLFIRRDTACSGIDPDPNQTKLTIINSDIHSTDIVGLRLIQNWYWDDRKKRLEIYLVATAPLKNINNEAGEFLFKMPIFYRRTDD
jgi:hypothetical protein